MPVNDGFIRPAAPGPVARSARCSDASWPQGNGKKIHLISEECWRFFLLLFRL
jgi:hypothetical protein